MTRTYLVTGGAGFIGSHLCEALLHRGNRVRVLDDLSTGRRSNLQVAADLQVGDVADAATVARAMDGVDGAFHLAAIASVARSTEAWAETHRTNLDGAINVFEAARHGPEGTPVPVVYASSAAVYGNNEALPLDEDEPLEPLTPYGADKAGCELHGRAAWEVFGIPNTGLRFFNVYGPRQDPRSPYSGVISIFSDRLTSGAPLRVFGDGGQTRDFVYVEDVVAALTGAMDRCRYGAAVFNVCTGRPTSINGLVQSLERAMGKRAFVQHDAARTGDIRASCGDPTALGRELGVHARTSLDDGLARLVSWQRAAAKAA